MRKNIFKISLYLTLILLVFIKPTLITNLENTFIGNILTSSLFHASIFIISGLGIVRELISIGKALSDKEWAGFEESDDVKRYSERMIRTTELTLTDVEAKLRNKIIFISIISLIMVLNDIGINIKRPIFGIQLSGSELTDTFIFKTFFWLIIYYMIYFFWSMKNLLIDWWLRLSGTIYTNINQQDIGGWWSSHLEKLEGYKNQALEVDEKMKELQLTARESNDKAMLYRKLVTPTLANLENVHKFFIKEPQVIASLKRFSAVFTYVEMSKNLKWILLDACAPLLLGAYALFHLYGKIWP